MKLRNKKTGEVVNVVNMTVSTPCEPVLGYETSNQIGEYSSLAKLNDEWEDYTPAKPLIKDEKIRKAVRAWAEACNLKHVTYKQASNEFYDANTRGAFAIRFTLIPVEVYLEDGEHYTIAELCGEEEE